MAKELAIAFLTLFVGAHLADRYGDALDRPLSFFRDVEPAWIGYAMFALLVAIAAEMSRTAWRTRNRYQTAVYLFVTCALTIAALTASFAPLHIVTANISLLALYLNYAWLLDKRSRPVWLTLHLSIPLSFVVADLFTYGAFWEKALDLYFVAAVMVHHHALEKSLTTGRREIEQPAADRQPEPNVL